MRRIIVGFIGAALLGAFACSSNENGTASLSGPSAVPTMGTSGPRDAGEEKCTGNCEFSATGLTVEGAKWHGDAMPTAVPSKGHPGHVTITFGASFWGAKLSWAKMHHGDKAQCIIWDDLGNKVYEVPNHCGTGEGSYVVYPTRTTTYTFKNKENADNSNDRWQLPDSVTVTLPTSISAPANVLWEPRDGYQTDDPTLKYTGTAIGSLSEIQVDATAPTSTRCGLGGGVTYSHLHATMTLTTVDGSPALDTNYDGNPGGCTAATGHVVLTLDPEK